jgi:MFS family permease
VLVLAAVFGGADQYLGSFPTLSWGAHLSWVSAGRFVYSESLAFAGALISGPLFGWFGQRWRVARAWVGAIVTAAAFCLEPFAHQVLRDPVSSALVARAEIAVGVLMFGCVVLSTGRRRLRHR